jgi:quinolinate synthase
VLLPDLKAGCSMADMADIDQVETAGKSTARSPATPRACDLHELDGGDQGVHRRARRHRVHLVQRERAMRWAFSQGDKVLFLPDQHLGRNTGFFKMGLPVEDMILWDPKQALGGNTPEAVAARPRAAVEGALQRARQLPARARRRGTAAQPGRARHRAPECVFEVVEKADLVGSTDFIIRNIEAAPPGTAWAVGTEQNLVARLAKQHPEQSIQTLSPFACQCATMFRLDPIDLMRSLEGIPQGELRFPIHVPEAVAADARLALERMLALPPG